MLENLKCKYQYVKTNSNYIFSVTKDSVFSVFTIIGFISLFISFPELIMDLCMAYPCLNKTVVGLVIFIFIVLIAFFKQIIFVLGNKRIKLLNLNGGHGVYVQYGDIFSKNEVFEPDKKRIVVIAVNRCFDTIIDDDLISSRSLHGIAMQNLYNNGTYTQNFLNEIIQKQLQGQENLLPTELSRSAKRKGNLLRYPVGTIVELEDDKNNIVYFFLALSKLNHDLKAETNDEEYMLALLRMLKYIDSRSQGMPVVLPLIGGFLSRTGLSEEYILNEIIQLIKINKRLLHGDVHIVVRNSVKDSIPIYNFAMKGE